MKKEIEYFVSPNKPAIYSAMAIALSSAEALSVIATLFSSDNITYICRLI